MARPKYRISQEDVTTYIATRLTFEERRKVAAWMEVFMSPSVVRNTFEKWLNKDPPGCLAIRIHEKFVRTGSVANDCKGNSV
jgi:hypothetical protein